MKHLIYTVAVQTFLSIPFVIAQCYFHHDGSDVGSVAYVNEPCSSSKFSACCGFRSTCLSNATTAVCYQDSDQTYSTGSCTDKSWSSGACPSFCVDGDPKGTLYSLQLCIVLNDGTFVFCCKNDDRCDCDTDVNTFRITNKTFINLASSSSVESSSTTRGSTSTSILSSIDGNKTVLTSASTLLSSTTSSPTTSTSTSPTASTSSSPDPLPAPTSGNHNTAIGAGVGIPLGLLAFASIAFLLRRDRRNMKTIQQLRQDNGDPAGAGNGIEEPGKNGIEKPSVNGIEQPSGNEMGSPKVQGFDEPEWRGRQAS